jgi:hypothetical protein
MRKGHDDYLRIENPGAKENTAPVIESLRLHIDALFDIQRFAIRQKETEHFEELDTLIRSKGTSSYLR